MANLLTILRMILAVIAMELIFSGRPELSITAFFITLIVIILDGLDGYVARKHNECSTFGSVFDIIGDRVVENIYWIGFAVLGWVGAWVPIVVVARGIITDGLRSMALAQGYTAFGKSTMMKEKSIGHFLTASRFSRALYGTAKALVFLVIIIAYIPNFEYFNFLSIETYFKIVEYQPYAITFANILVYITVGMCIIRGIPVILESKRFINNDKE